MTVHVVASKFAPHAGGSAVVWTNWCHYWPPEQLTVIAPKIPGWREFDQTQNYRIVRCGYPDVPKIRMPWLWAHQASALMALCLKSKPDVLHLSHVFENGFMGPFLKKFLGIPFFVHTYGEELQFALRFPWLRGLVSRVLRDASGVTTNSRYTQGLHGQFGYHRPVLIIHPAVDSLRYHPGPAQGIAQAKFGIPAGTLLLTTGRLMERKGHDSVLRLLPELLASFPNLHYAIAGIGPHQTRLQQIAQDLRLNDRVHFLGRVDDDDLPVLMREAAIFVHPNRVTAKGDVEGFGLVFLEAAASGVAVIGGRSGGVPDAVNEGINGILVEGEQELEAALRELLSNPARRQEMGRAGPDWARNFQWRTAAQDVWEYTVRVAAASGRPMQK